MKRPKPPGRKDKPLYVRVRQEDYDKMQNVAWSKKLLVSQWVRMVLLEALEK